MALQGSGQISFSDIINEFGSPSPAALGSYRVSQTIGELSNLPLDNGVPQTGAISFSDFYNKKLNVVVNYHSGGTEYQQDARDKYDANGITIVGGFKSVNNKPAAGNGAKVMIHVDKTIGSTQNVNNTVNRCALTTGSWNNTTLQIDLGSTARISGAGGNGGEGSEGSGAGEDGDDGTSGLGIQYSPTTINSVSGSIISAGFGGGGGGGGGHDHDKNSERTASGAGGGGGAGVPAGAGGGGGSGGTGGANGGAGSAGTADTAGEGNGGVNDEEEAYGGAGGEGGSNGEAADDGNRGFGGEGSSSSGGEGGESGAAIRRTNNSVSISINGPVSIRGAYNPAPTGVSEN